MEVESKPGKCSPEQRILNESASGLVCIPILTF
jgi:hypothetical protein